MSRVSYSNLLHFSKYYGMSGQRINCTNTPSLFSVTQSSNQHKWHQDEYSWKKKGKEMLTHLLSRDMREGPKHHGIYFFF